MLGRVAAPPAYPTTPVTLCAGSRRQSDVREDSPTSCLCRWDSVSEKRWTRAVVVLHALMVAGVCGSVVLFVLHAGTFR